MISFRMISIYLGPKILRILSQAQISWRCHNISNSWATTTTIEMDTRIHISTYKTMGAQSTVTWHLVSKKYWNRGRKEGSKNKHQHQTRPQLEISETTQEWHHSSWTLPCHKLIRHRQRWEHSHSSIKEQTLQRQPHRFLCNRANSINKNCLLSKTTCCRF